jgi:hypothetical protein
VETQTYRKGHAHRPMESTIPGGPHAHWKLPVRERRLRSRCRPRGDRALPLRHLRKTHGSAFSTVSNVPRDRFRWTKGESLLRAFESSPGKNRYFCTQCGSHIVAERAGAGNILLRMGCLDTEITERPVVHIWRSDAAPWFDPKDQLPEWPKGSAPKG